MMIVIKNALQEVGRVQLAQLLRALQVHAQELYVIRNRYLIIIMHVPKILSTYLIGA
ncbi:MAG: hypothetical protein GTN52_14855 [Hydrotalea flava]|nr:hypothetical protein [Hydrotalea flava]NIT20727.1 hypothetical protein [Hydrotalea flava]